MPAAGWRLSGVVAAAACAGACAGLVGIEESPPLRASSGGDAATDASAETGGGTGGAAGAAGADAANDVEAETGCGSAQPPGPPSGGDPGGSVDFVVAVRNIDLGDKKLANGPSWPTLGYDLDKLCTCDSDQLGSCKPNGKVVCDGTDGRDNALGQLVYQVGTLFSIPQLNSASLDSLIDGGSATILVRVRGWNGTPNDPAVEVDWYATDSFSAANPAPPKWDGSDAWPVLSTSLAAQTDADGGTSYDVDVPKYADKSAFVAAGTLVASFPNATFTISAATSIEFTAGLFTGKIQGSAAGWTLEDTILGGITSASNILGVLPSINDPLVGAPICMDNLLYSTIKGLICQYPDMTVLANPAIPCDHLSFGVAGRGDPAKLGPISVKAPLPNKCKPGQDPSTDKC